MFPSCTREQTCGVSQLNRVLYQFHTDKYVIASSKVGYTISMIGFAGLTVYMIFAASMSTSSLHNVS